MVNWNIIRGEKLDQISEMINNTNNNKIIKENIVEIDSETSPFISSEDYENLVNEKTSESEVINNLEQDGGARAESTSSTSIGSVTKLSRRETIDSDDSNLSYLSSSAHTEGVYDVDQSEVNVDTIEKINEDYESSPEMSYNLSEEKLSSANNFDSEIEESTISPVENKIVSSEINTTDINMLSSD